MRTHDLDPNDETAMRDLLTAAVYADPEFLTRRPPALTLIGARAGRLRQVRRAQQASVAVAVTVIAAVAVAVLPPGHLPTGPAADPTVVSTGTTMVATSASMEPALHIGDSLTIDTTARTGQQLRRGDIIVFKDPGGWLPPPPSGEAVTWMVKRVIGLPGDKITCCDGAGRLTVNGVALDEPYVAAGDRPSEIPFTVTVRQDRFWVMGDHRSVSADSRYHRDNDEDGQVPQGQVVGRVTAVSSTGSTSSMPSNMPLASLAPPGGESGGAARTGTSRVDDDAPG